jgi:hypothetical protein
MAFKPVDMGVHPFWDNATCSMYGPWLGWTHPRVIIKGGNGKSHIWFDDVPTNTSKTMTWLYKKDRWTSFIMTESRGW